MKKLFQSLLAICGLASAASAAEAVLNEGDCWSYTTRPGEEASFVVIRKIETLPKLGEVIHISVFGLKIKNPTAPEGFTKQAGHLPIASAQVRESLRKKLTRKAPAETDWLEGYNMWHAAYLSGKAGIFTISVSKCVEVLEESIRQGSKQ